MMRCQRLFILLIKLVSFVGTSEGCTAPGQSAATYSDGSFSIPNGNTATYSSGSTMYITWSTTYASSTVWLISGCDYSNPTKSLVVGTTAKSFEWEVSTTSTNSSEVYLFRIVNATGSTSSQRSGGFVSASFYISGGPTSSSSSSSSSSSLSSSTLSTSTTTQTSPDTTSATLSAPLTTSTTNSSADLSSGLSTGAKAGIGAGVGVGAVAILSLGAFFFLKKKSDESRPAETIATTSGYASQGYASPGYSNAELQPDGQAQPFMYVPYKDAAQLDGTQINDTQPKDARPVSELPSSPNRHEVYEMPGQ